MAKARWADGLRKGSTKTKTYSTLPTRKEGRVQIVKDRVYEVSNPQSDPQMLHRVCFVTASQAAAKMYDIISISQEGESKPEYARQLFISQNTEFLKKAAYKRVGLARHYRAAYAPKGNQQLIPNSYQVSKGSLTVPEYLVPKTSEGGASFAYRAYGGFGILRDGGFSTGIENPLVVGNTYTATDIWQILFGLQPGDQLTFPQIGGSGIAQALYEGVDEGSSIADKTLVTTFCAPRVVLKTEMPSTEITITAQTTAEQVAAVMRAGINEDASFTTIVDNFFNAFQIEEILEDSKIYFYIGELYDGVYGVIDNIRALGVILSRYNSERKMWEYSTSNLVCVWDFLSENSGNDYFGFTVDNAIATYRASVLANANGNFLQRGGTPDIVPASFR
jgi:hypothetical protein